MYENMLKYIIYTLKEEVHMNEEIIYEAKVRLRNFVNIGYLIKRGNVIEGYFAPDKCKILIASTDLCIIYISLEHDYLFPKIVKEKYQSGTLTNTKFIDAPEFYEFDLDSNYKLELEVISVIDDPSDVNRIKASFIPQ